MRKVKSLFTAGSKRGDEVENHQVEPLRNEFAQKFIRAALS